MHLLLSFHRRFLLRQKFGRRWRAHLFELTRKHGLSVSESAISHVVAADWPSRGFKIESLVVDALGLSFREVWPEYHGTKIDQANREAGTAGSDEARV